MNSRPWRALLSRCLTAVACPRCSPFDEATSFHCSPSPARGPSLPNVQYSTSSLRRFRKRLGGENLMVRESSSLSYSPPSGLLGSCCIKKYIIFQICTQKSCSKYLLRRFLPAFSFKDSEPYIGQGLGNSHTAPPPLASRRSLAMRR